ncbi:MAG: DNA primase [Deltaproteobacteria bacterium]|nr:DNA primase [Deltaproteobacteria bacterium]
MIPSEIREQIRSALSLHDVVSQYVPLRKAGSSYLARCPFHDEKSPSFHVSASKGVFHCFGCKASGDLFEFYQRIEGVTFPEAMRALAERAGIEIVEEDRDPQKIAEERRSKELSERLYFACETAAAFFEHCLQNAERSAMARDAIAARGVSPEMSATFRLGYAPGEWGALTEHMRSHGVSPMDAELAGLLVPRNSGSGFYDRFRHRLMFPVCDRQNRVVGFSGRLLPVTEDMEEGVVPEETGKYINSPETPIYKKSDLLYGTQVARGAMQRSAEAILVEGNFDVVAMHQHGFANTVCPLGTAFTDNQARLLRRYAEVVTILFDADEAGRKAVRSSQSACARARLSARVCVLPSSRGKDPDEVLRAADGPAFVTQAITSAQSLVEWLIDDASSRGGDTVPERVAALRELAPLLAAVPDEIERAAYVEHTARRFLFMERSIVERVVEEARKRSEAAPRQLEAQSGESQVESSSNAPKAAVKTDISSKANADIIESYLRCPQLLESAQVDAALPLLQARFARPLLALARQQWQSAGALDGGALLTLCPNERAKAWIAERLQDHRPINESDELVARQTIGDCIARLRKLLSTEGARRLRLESARAEAAGDRDRAALLQREAIQLMSEQHPRSADTNSKRSVG